MMTQKKWFAAVAIFWIIIIGGFIGYKQYTISTGTEVWLRMRPVDPRDLFRGDYMTIRYEISDVGGQSYNPGDVVYAKLDMGAGMIVSDSVFSRTPPSEGLYLKGTVENSGRVAYGIESYFIPQGTGYDLATRLRVNPQNTYVRVSVDGAGRGIVRGFVVNGENIDLKDLKK